MKLYSHVQIYDIKRVIENLPDYPWPGSQQMQQAKATGTYDIDVTKNNFAICLAKSGVENPNQPESTGGTLLDSDIETPVLTGPGRILTYDQWIMSPLTKSSKGTVNKALTKNELIDFANCLAKLSQKHNDLAEIIKAWPKLSEKTKRAITYDDECWLTRGRLLLTIRQRGSTQ